MEIYHRIVNEDNSAAHTAVEEKDENEEESWAMGLANARPIRVL